MLQLATHHYDRVLVHSRAMAAWPVPSLDLRPDFHVGTVARLVCDTK